MTKEHQRVLLGLFRLSQGWTTEQCSEEWSKIRKNKLDEIKKYVITHTKGQGLK